MFLVKRPEYVLFRTRHWVNDKRPSDFGGFMNERAAVAAPLRESGHILPHQEMSSRICSTQPVLCPLVKRWGCHYTLPGRCECVHESVSFDPANGTISVERAEFAARLGKSRPYANPSERMNHCMALIGYLSPTQKKPHHPNIQSTQVIANNDFGDF